MLFSYRLQVFIQSLLVSALNQELAGQLLDFSALLIDFTFQVPNLHVPFFHSRYMFRFFLYEVVAVSFHEGNLLVDSAELLLHLKELFLLLVQQLLDVISFFVDVPQVHLQVFNLPLPLQDLLVQELDLVELFPLFHSVLLPVSVYGGQLLHQVVSGFV